MLPTRLISAATLAAALLWAGAAAADEASIRKNLAARLPSFPAIDEVRKTPVPGLYELRVGNNVLYADENGNHLIQGSLIDTSSRVNLTEARLEEINRIDFASLPLKDAIVMKQGNGERQLVVFEDPNCSFCRRFERDIQTVKDLTVYVVLYPILGADSTAKSRDIWCAKDPLKTWRAWMLDGTTPPKAPASCDSSAVDRNVALGQKYRVNGTPELVFSDGVRKSGALPVPQIERYLTAATAARKN